MQGGGEREKEREEGKTVETEPEPEPAAHTFVHLKKRLRTVQIALSGPETRSSDGQDVSCMR